MELNKITIQKGQQMRKITHQFQIDTDLNVPDAREDVQKILQSDGILHITDITTAEQYIKLSGTVDYQVLYATEDEDHKIACIDGKIQVEELIYTDHLENVKYTIECSQLELSTTLIHSRKLNIKAVLEVEVDPLTMVHDEITTDIDTEAQIMKRMASKPILQLETQKKDTYRIKEEIKLSGTKENIGSLLMSKIGSHKIDTRIGQDEITFRGEFQFFCMYISDEWKEDWVSQTVTFEGRMECYGATDSMYHHMKTAIDDLSVDVQMDEDGEMRILGIEATLKMDLKVYNEEKIEILEDMYALDQHCELSKRQVQVESLVLQNQSKCRVVENLALPELKDELLQICNAGGMVQTESIELTKEGIIVEGILHINFLYVRGDDQLPYASWSGMVPFKHVIDCKMTQDIIYDVESKLEQISVTMAGNEEIEVKAIVGFHSFVRKTEIIEVIEEIQVRPYTKQEMGEQVGIIGYIYKDSDDLWTLAKCYHTTVEGICAINNISEKDVKAGQKLLIFKDNLSIL